MLQNQNLKSEIDFSKIDFSPKGYVIKYPFLIDIFVKDFIDINQNNFKKTKDNIYKLRTIPKNLYLKDLIQQSIDNSIKTLTSSFISSERNAWIIIVDSGSERHVELKMLEDDIDINLKSIEKCAISIFNKRMKDSSIRNHIYCKHRSLESNDWITILKKKVFGKSNLFIIDDELKCLKEQQKEIDKENPLFSLSKKEKSLIINECLDWLKLKMKLS